MFNRKKKIVTGVSVVCLILLLCLIGPYLAKNMYVHWIICPQKALESYDGKFAFLKMPTTRWYVRDINVYDARPAIGKQQIETFEHSYNKYDMKEIMWGNQSYDLFFLTTESQYIYKYDEKEKQWIGPLYFDISATMEKRLQGIDDVYCFEPMGSMVGGNYLPLTEEFCQVSKQAIPSLIAEDNEKILRKYIEGDL